MTVRPFPSEARVPGLTRAFVSVYRKAFDLDPAATFVAGEVDGVTIVLAVGDRGRELQRFVENSCGGR